ncbi:zinc finger BED domain-containing protein RICESLEEPER 2-like [Rutidosis leptorrhynchoides]|uniref:zinc finger BED domain-containing protein RICESLEEPER 2-like n=1 Tax=Rutidosis leptorrhynchoides TaxID=125765 RepID=UPI003A99DD74
MEWDIDRKLSTFTVDNCSTNDLMLKLLKEKLSGEYLMLEGRLLHMRCVAHILNIIVKDSLVVIGESIEKIRDSVMYWRATAKRSEEFEKQARKLKVLATKKLVCYCITRWNSIYMMLDVALGYKEVFSNMKLKAKNYVCLPSDGDWKLAEDIFD